jgi:hypothetical protein
VVVDHATTLLDAVMYRYLDCLYKRLVEDIVLKQPVYYYLASISHFATPLKTAEPCLVKARSLIGYFPATCFVQHHA